MFEKLEERIYIDYEIHLLSDTMVNNGVNKLRNPDNILLSRPNGDFYVPGSSIKGILRSSLESAVRAYKDDSDAACDPTQWGGACGECPICTIFGGGDKDGYASSIIVHDADLSEDLGTTTRTMVGIDRKTGAKSDGVLYNLESQQKGSILNGDLIIENPGIFPKGKKQPMAKLGALLSAIRLFNLVGGIGGGTSRGWGDAVIVITKISSFNPTNFINFLKDVKTENESFKREELFLNDKTPSIKDLRCGNLNLTLDIDGIENWWGFVDSFVQNDS